jgi:predicted unusual protein kinase regulating ubiquinone biosynthesis (AarF/ABC1/UbiB family)
MGISFKGEHLKRYKDIAVLLLKYGRGDLLTVSGLDEAIDDTGEHRDSGKAEDLPGDLEELGPSYVKLGQFLSTRSDMLPLEYIDVLERLQDNVKSFPFSEVEKIINSELGVKISRAFLTFEEKPVGAASLGQVHRAELRDGRLVVVKVQRPGIREEIMKDMEVFGEIAAFLQEHTETGRKYLLDDMMSEFRKSLMRELNYKNEEQNLKILAENLKEFHDLVIPAPVEDYTTSSILTMDYIKGKKITSITPLRKMEINGSGLAETLFHSYLKQIVIDGFYHADPHPGNIFITGDDRLAILDLGMAGYVSGSMQQYLLYILLAIGDGRGDDVAKYAMKMGRQTGSFRKGEFESQVNELIARYVSMPLKNIEIGKVIIEITRISGSNGIYIPSEMTMLGKTLLNLDKIGKTLDPDFEPNAAIQKYSARLLKQKLTQSANSAKSYELLLESKEFLEKIPGRLNSILDKVSNNELELKVRSIDEVYLMSGFQKIANRISAGIILGSLILGAALIMRLETSFTIFGYPGIAIIFFLIAAVCGIWVVFNAVIKDDPLKKKEDKTG